LRGRPTAGWQWGSRSEGSLKSLKFTAAAVMTGWTARAVNSGCRSVFSMWQG
jgi:hypothetical protein